MNARGSREMQSRLLSTARAHLRLWEMQNRRWTVSAWHSNGSLFTTREIGAPTREAAIERAREVVQLSSTDGGSLRFEAVRVG